MTNKVRIHRDDGKVIGVVEAGVFHKSIDSRKHKLDIPPALANDVSALHEAEKAGAIWVHIFDDATQKNYWAPIKLIWEKGQNISRGHGLQRALLLTYWQTEPSEQQSFF